MKIAIIIQDLFGQGVQYAMAAVARGIEARGISVDILVSQVHKEFLDNISKTHVVPFEIPSTSKLIYLPSRRARGNIWAVRKYLKTARSDVVMSTSGPYHLCLRLASCGLLKRPKLVNVDHMNWGSDLQRKPFPAKKQSLIQRFWTRWFYAGFDWKYFVNETSRQIFLNQCPFFDSRRTVTVFNPVIDEIFYRKRECPAQHPWLRKKTMPTFIAAGAYHPVKDHMTLLHAFRTVVHTCPARLIIYGRGPLEEQYRKFVYENQLEDFVSIAGYTNNLPAEMNNADGFILSSCLESFGIVIVEALACGLPVISTDAPYGPSEILHKGKFGTLVPVGDSEKMSQAILRWLSGERIVSPPNVWRSYTIEAVTDRYLSVLKN